MQLGADGCSRREGRFQVAFLGAQLAPHLGCCQAGRKALGAELWGGLALAVAKRAYSGQEIGALRFRTLPPTQAKGINTAHATRECAHALAKGHAPPPQCARSALLPTRPPFLDGPCHKQAPGTPLERLGSVDPQRLERVGQVHGEPSSMRVPGV
jgi:hypothetical protein